MSLSPTRFGANATPLPAVLPPLSAALSRRAALFGAVTVAGVSAVTALPAMASASLVSLAVAHPAPDAPLIALAGRVEALADRRRATTERVKRLALKVEAAHPRPSRPVTNEVFHAYHAEIRPTEERVGLVQLRKVRQRMAERADRWTDDLAAMKPSTSAGLGAKAAAVLAIGDLSGESEGAESLLLSVLEDAVRLGTGALS